MARSFDTETEVEARLLESVTGTRYEIVRLIGRGSLGVVFLGRDRKLHRTIALKLLRPEYSGDPEQRANFLREARMTAHLQHEGVVPVLDVLEGEQAIAVAMPFAGDSLERVLAERGGTLPPDDAREILERTADILAYVHRAGVVHRDVKPSNVLVERENGAWRVRLTDFGTAMLPLRDYGHGRAPDPGGSPAFAPPEQAMNSLAADARSDVYALGVLGYLMCSGRMPFGMDRGGVRLERQLKSEFTPLRDVAPAVPQSLARIIERCLRGDPNERWPGAAALGDACRRDRATPGWWPFGASARARRGPPITTHAEDGTMVITRSWSAIRGTLGQGAKTLRRTPGYSLFVISTLALGIGANATMLGVLDEMVLRPPRAVRDAQELVTPALTIRRGSRTFTNSTLPYPVLTALQRRPDLFQGVSGFSRTSMSYGAGADAREVRATRVGAEYFDVLGTHPARGRFMTPGEDRAAIVVVSDGFWRSALGGAPDVVGRTLVLDRVPLTIIGVAPPGFAGTRADVADVWVPMEGEMARATHGEAWRTEANTFWLQIVARLRPGVAPEQAAAAASATIREAFPAGSDARATASLTLAPVLPARDALSAESRAAVLLSSVSLFVLLAACANVANLALARNARRERELAVRLALGLSRPRLVFTLLSEALLLSLAGGAAALIIVRLSGTALLGFLGAASATGVALDARTIAMTLGLTLLSALVAGLVPALLVLRGDLGPALRASGRGLSPSGSVAREALLAVQCAMCALLIVGSGLFERSLSNVAALRLGFDPDSVWTARENFAAAGYDGARIATLMRDIRERATRVPGVSSTALASNTPFSGMAWALDVRMPGRDSLPDLPDGGPYYTSVSDGYFRTMGTRIVQGRAIDSSDVAGGPRVAVINETVGRVWFPGENSIGRCLLLGGDRDQTCTTIVGVAEDVRRLKLVEAGSGMLYLPLAQQASAPNGLVLVARARNGADLAAPLRRLMQTSAANLPYAHAASLDESLGRLTRSWRLAGTLFSIFGALVAVIVAIGVFGVFSFAVAQRTREIGIRMALGAAANRVRWMILGRGAVVAGVGVAAGIVGVALAAPIVEPLLFRTSPVDAGVLVAAAAVVLVIALLACFFPARRATRVDPMAVLRME